MPFGLCNVPATLERLMKRVLAGLQWYKVLPYLDDDIAYGPILEEQRKVFDRLCEAHIKIEQKMCFFCAASQLSGACCFITKYPNVS